MNKEFVIPSELSRAVRAEREARGMTRPQLASAAAVATSSLASLELGPARYNNSGRMRSDVVFRVLEALGCTCEQGEGCSLCVHVSEWLSLRPKVYKVTDGT